MCYKKRKILLVKVFIWIKSVTVSNNCVTSDDTTYRKVFDENKMTQSDIVLLSSPSCFSSYLEFVV